MQLFEAFWGAGGSLQPYKRIVRPVAEWHAAAAEVRGLSTAVWGRRKGFVATTAGTGRKRQQGLWHYDMQLQRRFEAVPGGKQLLLGHAAAAEVRGRSGGQTAGTGTGRNRQEGLWHYGMQLQRRLEAFPGGKRQAWNRRKGFVATTAGTGTGRNGSTACGTMACSCSGGSEPFRGADGRPGTVEKDLLRPRQALALEGSGGKACGTMACSCSRGFEAFPRSKRQSWNRRKECCNHGRNGTKASSTMACSCVRSLSGRQTAVLEPYKRICFLQPR